MRPMRTKLIISISYNTYEAIKERMGKKDRAIFADGYYSKSQVEEKLGAEVDELYGFRVQQMLAAREKRKKGLSDCDQVTEAKADENG